MGSGPRFMFSADEIVKDSSIVEDYRAPFMWVWDWSYKGTGENVAKVINILARRGWILHEMSTTTGQGLAGKTLGIYCVFRKVKQSGDS